MVNLAVGPHFSLRIKFGENICKSGWLIAESVIFNMAAAAILNFEKFEFYLQNQLQDPIFCLCEILC